MSDEKLWTVELEALCRGGVRVWADTEEEAAKKAKTNPPNMFRAHSISTVKVHGIYPVTEESMVALEALNTLPRKDDE